MGAVIKNVRKLISFILLIVSGLLFVAASGVIYRCYQSFKLMLPGNEEARDICINAPYMDCDPTGWEFVLLAGIVSAFLSALMCFAAKRIWPSMKTATNNSLEIQMKSRIGIVETCLYLLSLLSIFGVVFSLIAFAEMVSPGSGQKGGVFITLIIPGCFYALAGVAYHFCAKAIKRASYRAWVCAVVLFILPAFLGVFAFLENGFPAGFLQTVVAIVGLWAAFQRGTREALIKGKTIKSM